MRPDQKRFTEAFPGRVKNILLHPRDEWQTIKEEQTTYWSIIIRYLAIMAAIPPVSAIAARLTIDRGIVSNTIHSPLVYVIATNVVWYFVIIINIIITAAVITAVVEKNHTGWIGHRGLKLAVYSFTPSFLVCILIIIPRLNWLLYVAIVYSIYLLYVGIRSMTEAGQVKAAWYAGTSFFAVGLIVGILNMFEYMLESFIARKVFF